MTNLSGLTSLTTAAAALANLVLVTPGSTKGYQPLNKPNADGSPSDQQLPPTFVFHYEGEQKVVCESDITDHYVENNFAIQDQIALKPEVYTTRGFIGELNNIVPDILLILKQTSETLVPIGAYSPQLSETALLEYNNALFTYQQASVASNSAVSAWTSLTTLGQESQNVINSGTISTVGSQQNKQQSAFSTLYGYWSTRTLFNVQTPWAVFQNMAIVNLTATQTDETNQISEFEITFKSIRTAQSINLQGNLSQIFSGRSAMQAAGIQNNGTNTPQSAASIGSKVGF